VSFRVDYLAPGSRQHHQHAGAVPLYPDPGVLGADATSNTLHMPNEYIDDMAHLLTSIESLSKPALVALAIYRVHIVICLAIVFEILYQLT
jgi:hypothetical protein